MFKKISFILLVSTKIFALAPNESLNRLIEGNKRFCNQSFEQIQSNKFSSVSFKEHSPFAVVVACSDARVAPEIVFDQGIGDLFVVRVAGNVIGSFELESIQYAVAHLGASCILVMGHQNCGAVDAVVQNQIEGIPFLAQMIQPAVVLAKQYQTNNILRTSIELNAIRMAAFLKQFNIFKTLQSNGKLLILPAYYNFQTGRVDILKPFSQMPQK